MRSSLLVALTIAGIALGPASAYAQRDRENDDQAAGRYSWRFSLAAGMREARETGKPVMVVLRCVP